MRIARWWNEEYPSSKDAIAMLIPPEFPPDAMDTEDGILIVADWWEEQGVGLIAERLRAYVAKRREGRNGPDFFIGLSSMDAIEHDSIPKDQLVAAIQEREHRFMEQQAETMAWQMWTTPAQRRRRRREFLADVKLEPEPKK